MSNNVFRVLVTFCQPLDINDGGRSIRGTQIKYLMAGEDLAMLQVQKGFNVPLGYQNLKCFLDLDVMKQLPAAPAFYDCEFRMRAGSDGRLVSVPVSFTYVGDAVFSCAPDPLYAPHEAASASGDASAPAFPEAAASGDTSAGKSGKAGK